MKVYFVRHGESVFNVSRLRQHGQVPLSETGQEQARVVGKRLEQVSPELIISSDFLRAKESAEIINGFVKKEIIYTDLARERMASSEVHGKPVSGAENIEIEKIILANIHNPDFHYSDEENFFDMKKRAKKFLDFISRRAEDKIIVVLHGNILRYLVASMLYGETYSWEVFTGFFKFVVSNTGVTICEMKEDSWKILSWNDHSHLS